MTYLITGGAGSLGRALTSHLLSLPSTERLVIFSRGEHRQAQMRAEIPDDRLEFHIGDVRSRERIDRSLRFQPDVVIHAAALKRIEVCQANPTEAHLTNVIGTQHVCEAAVAAGIPRVVVISSDKSCASITTYGSTKAAAENLALGEHMLRGASRTRISVARYGNCYDSAGAVLHTFKAKREANQPIPITHPDMTRFWWSLAEAAQFVVGVTERMKGGEIWVPKIGGARVVDLARAVWPAAPIEIVGVRGLEKLHEVMVTEDEARFTYDVGSAYVILPRGGELPRGAVLVPEGFRLSSETAPAMDWRTVAA